MTEDKATLNKCALVRVLKSHNFYSPYLAHWFLEAR